MARKRKLQVSLRFLLIATVFIALLLGIWNATAPRAVTDVTAKSGGWTPTILAPYLLRVGKTDYVTVTDTYYVWCLGTVCELPFSRQRPDPNGIILTVRPRIVIQPEPELEKLPFQER